MRPGDLVFHKEDIKDGKCVPGLIVGLHFDQADDEAIVRFTDRTFDEYHILEDLTKVEDYKEENSSEHR